LDYDGATRKVEGIRVQVLGEYPKSHLWLADGVNVELLDYSVAAAPPKSRFRN
jgi:hypothetical protein